MDIEKEIEIYLMNARPEKFTYNTTTNYKCRIRAFLKYFEHKASPEDITLEEFKTYLDAQISPNTKLTNVNAVKSFYLLTKRDNIDFKGFNKTPRKKQFRIVSNERETLRYVSEKLGVHQSLIEVIPVR